VKGCPETFFIDKARAGDPLPANKSGQQGHIVGPATAALLYLGIRTAMNAPAPSAAQ
jgi:hypothetical protein